MYHIYIFKFYITTLIIKFYQKNTKKKQIDCNI
jgi:hypothetical protein